MLLSEDLRHLLAMFHANARHWRQIPHGDLRGDAAFTDLLLHRFRQCVHQRQAPRHPGRAAVETARQLFDRVAVLVFHLGQQPALFERGFRLAVGAQRMHKQQGLGLAQRVLQHERLDCVTPQLSERGDALMSIDYQIPIGLLDDNDGRLLPGFSQRRQQSPESRWVADPEVLQAAVQLMKLQVLRHGFQYAGAADWSFAVNWGCCSEPVSTQ